MNDRVLHLRAPAKLNLYLRIDGTDERGYHLLTTVFHSVPLCDQLTLRIHDRGGLTMAGNRPWLPCDSRNLAFRAAERFFEVSGVRNRGLRIDLRKKIPVGAGMGGGSADAAAVLDGLNRAFGRPLDASALDALALGLGADVPFCLHGGAALAYGVGERLTPVDRLPPCTVVAVKPGVHVSTKEAFGWYDAFPPQTLPGPETLLDGLRTGSLTRIAAGLHNALEAPVTARHPQIGEARTLLLTHGALGARMTGSGAAVFGLFDDPAAARAAFDALKPRWKETFLMETEEEK